MLEKLKRFEAWFTLQRRGILYRILVGIAVALGGYGVLSEHDLAVTLALLGALFGTSLAAVKSPVRRQ